MLASSSKRHQDTFIPQVSKYFLANFFMLEVNLVSVVVDSCLETLDQEHDWIGWHLLIGPLKLLKAFLVHNENKHLSIPVTCAIHVNELLALCTFSWKIFSICIICGLSFLLSLLLILNIYFLCRKSKPLLQPNPKQKFQHHKWPELCIPQMQGATYKHPQLWVSPLVLGTCIQA